MIYNKKPIKSCEIKALSLAIPIAVFTTLVKLIHVLLCLSAQNPF
jgi:hypothetical protein